MKLKMKAETHDNVEHEYAWKNVVVTSTEWSWKGNMFTGVMADVVSCLQK